MFLIETHHLHIVYYERTHKRAKPYILTARKFVQLNNLKQKKKDGPSYKNMPKKCNTWTFQLFGCCTEGHLFLPCCEELRAGYFSSSGIFHFSFTFYRTQTTSFQGDDENTCMLHIVVNVVLNCFLLSNLTILHISFTFYRTQHPSPRG